MVIVAADTAVPLTFTKFEDLIAGFEIGFLQSFAATSSLSSSESWWLETLLSWSNFLLLQSPLSSTQQLLCALLVECLVPAQCYSVWQQLPYAQELSCTLLSVSESLQDQGAATCCCNLGGEKYHLHIPEEPCVCWMCWAFACKK